MAAALLLVGAGCGGEGGDENADPAKVAPQGTLFYAAATIRPEGDQKDAVDAIGRKVFRTADPGERIQRELDREFKEDPTTRDATYAEDIEPWLGRRIGVALTRLGPGGQTQWAAIIASKDNGKAKETIEQEAKDQRAAKRTYKDATYYYDAADTTGFGVVGNYVVLGTEPALRAVIDASKAKGLAEKADFNSAASGSEDKLGFGYFDLNAVVAGLNASGQLPPGQAQGLRSLLGGGSKPVTMSLAAQSDRVSLEVIARGIQQQQPASPPSELVSTLPGDAWLALGARLGDSVKQITSQLGGSLEAAGQQLSTTIDGARGIRITSGQMPGAINAVVKGDTLVIAYGDLAARDAFAPASRLGDSPDYKAAQESLGGSQPSLFVVFGPIAELVGTQADPQAQQAKTYLSGLKTLAVGTKQDGDTQTARFVLTVK
jgi:hypothetical protein